jgi:hypothetical protein
LKEFNNLGDFKDLGNIGDLGDFEDLGILWEWIRILSKLE